MPIRLYILDDHAVFRSGLRALLERERDFEIVGDTGSGMDALTALDAQPVDILLLDISIPGLPGPRVAEAALRKFPRLGIVVLTMHEDEYYLQELLRIGVRGYVLKKSSDQELVHAINAVARGESFVDPALSHHVISPYVGRITPKKSERIGRLTQREQEVCQLLAYGHTNTQVAERLFISERTVETHRNNIMGKLELKTRAELVRFAIDNGLFKLS